MVVLLVWMYVSENLSSQHVVWIDLLEYGTMKPGKYTKTQNFFEKSYPIKHDIIQEKESYYAFDIIFKAAVGTQCHPREGCFT